MNQTKEKPAPPPPKDCSEPKSGQSEILSRQIASQKHGNLARIIHQSPSARV